MSLKISDLAALNTVTVGATGFTPKLLVEGSNSGGLAEIYVSAGSGNALRLNTNFANGNYIDINPYITGISNGGFEINQNGTQRFVITAGGNVGIGTTSDAGYKLNVNGGFYGSYFKGGDSGAGSVIANFVDVFGTSVMYVRGDNRVGIGTTTPQKPLEVISAANDFVSIGVNQIGVGVFTGIHFGYRESNNSYRKSAIVFQRTDLTSNDAQGKVHILNGPQGSSGNATLADAKLTIAENGNVGINSQSPTYRLTAYNNARNTDVLCVATDQINSDSAQSFTGISLQDQYANGGGNASAIRSYSNLYSQWGTTLTFSTTASSGNGVVERIRITPNGLVGINTNNPTDILDVRGNVRVSGNGVNDGGLIGFGNYLNGNGYYDNAIYRSALSSPTTAGNLLHISSYEALVFTTQAASIGTQAIRMYINGANGNVVIGGVTDAGYKLDVNGTLRATGGISFSYGSGIKAVNYTYNNILLTGYDPSAGDYVDFYTAGDGSSNATKKIRILNNGTTTFYGNVYAPAFFNSSDIRLKEIVDYDYNISDIKPISYLWKDLRDNKKHVGYSAQEVQKIMPDAVNEDAYGMLSVNYIEVLVAKIAELENRIKQLEK